MTREEEIIAKAKQEGESCNMPKAPKGLNSAYELGFYEGAQWADLHPSTELIKKVAEQILMFNHITPDCWSQWMADGCVEQIKKILER